MPFKADVSETGSALYVIGTTGKKLWGFLKFIVAVVLSVAAFMRWFIARGSTAGSIILGCLAAVSVLLCVFDLLQRRRAKPPTAQVVSPSGTLSARAITAPVATHPLSQLDNEQLRGRLQEQLDRAVSLREHLPKGPFLYAAGAIGTTTQRHVDNLRIEVETLLRDRPKLLALFRVQDSISIHNPNPSAHPLFAPKLENIINRLIRVMDELSN